MLKPELEEQGYGSAFDPVLTGVAHGLARLFPPIDNACRREQDEKARGQDVRIGATEPVGSQPRS